MESLPETVRSVRIVQQATWEDIDEKIAERISVRPMAVCEFDG